MRDDEFMLGSCSDHARIMLGSWSNRPRIGIDASTVVGEFCLDFGVRFCVAVAVLRVMPVAPRIVNDVSYVTKINHESHFAWQAQHLVRLAGDACCCAHCK